MALKKKGEERVQVDILVMDTILELVTTAEDNYLLLWIESLLCLERLEEIVPSTFLVGKKWKSLMVRFTIV